MTPEERERLMERMPARGLTPQAARPAASPTAASGATTFDALFGPLAQPETTGQVWLNVDNKLQRVRLRLGITDGQQTELIQALDGELKEVTDVVTNVLTGAVRQVVTPQGGAGFPGLGGRQSGFQGGGGG